MTQRQVSTRLDLSTCYYPYDSLRGDKSLEFGYRLDIDPHEDLYRVIALCIVEVILAILVYKGAIPVDQFYGLSMLIVGYLVGRVRGKKEE